MTSIPLKYSPIYGQALKLGAQFTEISGWQMPQVFTSLEDEVAVAQQGVVLMDASASGKILFEGEGIQAMFKAKDIVLPKNIGDGMPLGAGYCYRLRADQFFFHLSPGEGEEVMQRLTQPTANKEISRTVTDVTHGWADLLLVGPKASTLLSRLCGLDLLDDNFPDLTAQQSSVAKTRQLIIRRDFKTENAQSFLAYSLVGDRSLAAYLWDVLLESGHDLDIIPAGKAAFDKLSLIDS